jgi:hypothetical protein
MRRIPFPSCGIRAGFFVFGTLGALSTLLVGTGHGLAAPTEAGVAAAVAGQVSLTAKDQDSKRAAVSGAPIFVLDKITTGDSSQLQVLLRDETTFMVGPNTEMEVDEMVFDPNAVASSKLTAEIAKGAFSYNSGKIGESKPENVTIKTPVGILGVRGTSLFGIEEPGTGKMFIGLLGPGRDNDGNLRNGGFTLTNAFGTTNVSRAGFGVSVAPGQAPGDPVRIPAQYLSLFLQQLRTEVGGAHAGASPSAAGASIASDAEALSGHTTATIQSNASNVGSINKVDSSVTMQTEIAAQYDLAGTLSPSGGGGGGGGGGSGGSGGSGGGSGGGGSGGGGSGGGGSGGGGGGSHHGH